MRGDREKSWKGKDVRGEMEGRLWAKEGRMVRGNMHVENEQM